MNDYKLAFQKDDNYPNLTPADCLNAMLAHTDEEGNLAIPGWILSLEDGERETVYALKMAWNKDDRQAVLADFEKLCDDLKAIAPVLDDLGDTREENRDLLPEHLLNVWDVYVRPYDIGDLDIDTIRDISERLYNAYCVKMHPDKRDQYTPEELTVTDEEEAMYREYEKRAKADIARRIEKTLAASEVIVCADRLCRLYALDAPDIIINNEAKQLAQIMAVNRYGLSMEEIDVTEEDKA